MKHSDVIFDGRLHTHYGQAYVLSGDGDGIDAMDESFRGQQNGLLGAAKPGTLFLMTGLHTGIVQFQVRVLAAPPVEDDRAWEECVEASCTPRHDVRLIDWDGTTVCAIPLEERPYRVRYRARGMDAASEADTVLADEEPVDAYELSFWPAGPAPDRIVKQTSAIAAYWHRWARGL